MPVSSSEGKPWARSIIPQVFKEDPAWIVDIGCGAGFWYDTLEGLWTPKPMWTGVEVWEPYVRQYDLLKKYHEVLIEDARVLQIWMPADLMIFGDVLEHMEKLEAVQMVNRYLWEHAIISLPIVNMPQGPGEDGNPYEEHVATWSYEEVCDTFPVKLSYRGNLVGVFIL